MYVSETIVVYDIKVGSCSKVNEYMNLYGYQRSKSFIDHGLMSLRFNVFNFFSLETARPFKTKFHMEPSWDVQRFQTSFP